MSYVFLLSCYYFESDQKGALSITPIQSGTTVIKEEFLAECSIFLQRLLIKETIYFKYTKVSLPKKRNICH